MAGSLLPARHRDFPSRIARQFLSITTPPVVPLGKGDSERSEQGVHGEKFFTPCSDAALDIPCLDLPPTTPAESKRPPLDKGELQGGLLMQPPRLVESGPWHHLTSDGILTEHNVDRALAPTGDSSNDACWDPAKRSH